MKRNALVVLFAAVLIVLFTLSSCATTQKELLVTTTIAPSAEEQATPPVEQEELEKPVVPETPAVVETERVEVAVIKEVVTPVEAAKKPEILPDTHVRFVASGNIRGQLFPYDVLTGHTDSHSQLYFGAAIEQMRTSGPPMVLLDLGNVLQGSAEVYYSNYFSDDSHSIATVMNEIGYDAMTFGNEDLETGSQVFMNVAKQLLVPVLAANFVDAETAEPLGMPYAIIEKGGVKIAVLGLVDPHTFSWLPENYYEGARFEDPSISAKKWIAMLRDTEQPAIIVGLLNGGTTELETHPAISLVNAVEGFDLIFTTDAAIGEAQDPLGTVVPIIGVDDSPARLTVADVHFSQDTASGAYLAVEIVGSAIPVETIELDSRILDRVEQFQTDVAEWLDGVAGTLGSSISSRDAMFGDSKYMDLIHTLQLNASQAQASLSGVPAFDAQYKQGPITVRQLFEAYPREEHLFVLDLTGDQLKAILEQSYGNWLNTMVTLNDDLILFAHDASGKQIVDPLTNTYKTTVPFNEYISLSGLSYVVEITRPVGSKVTIKTTSAGVRFDGRKQYTVVIPSSLIRNENGFLASAGLTTDDTKKAIIGFVDKDVRRLLIEQLSEKGTIVPAVDKNWLVIPSLWADRGAKTSNPKLFNVQN